jgi:crotonobetainyl-CoA:carnitine CoA-transferase CaiB-like acyl-CoA transferase
VTAHESPSPRGPLTGFTVVEFAQVIAGPIAGTLMADLGAEVIHVEAPGAGDAARKMGPAKDGEHLWWKVIGRNKRSVTLDLHQEAGRAIAHRLVARADVVIVTFRADTVEQFGLDWASVSRINPSAVLLQISGYGANTSLRNEPGLGKMGEARSGAVHLTGFPDGPPIHTGFSHGDSTTGLMGAFAVAAALARRGRDPEHRGEWIDLALFETLYRLVDWQTIIHDQLGIAPMRAGNALAVAPGAVINSYLTSDREWVTVTSATPKTVHNIVRLLGLPLEEYWTVEQQNAARDDLDRALVGWMAQRPTADALEALTAAGVVGSKIFDAADIAADPTYAERGDIVTIDDSVLGPVRMPGVIPYFVNDPGVVWRTGSALGEDNDLVYGDWLGLSEDERAALAEHGTI